MTPPDTPAPDARRVLMRLWAVYVSAAIATVVVGLVAAGAGLDGAGGVEGGPLAAVVLLLPAVGYALVTRRSLSAETPAELAAEHRQRFFLGVALAESPALFGLVGLFLTGALWVLLLGAVVSGGLLAVHAPTERAVAREDERLRAQGKPVTLSEALAGPRSGS